MKIPVYTSATFAFILTGCALSSDEMTSRFLTHMSPANPALSGNVGIITVRERGWGISTMSSYLTTPVLLLNIAGLSSYLTTPVSSALEASLNIAGLLDPYPTLARYKIDVDILDVNYDLFAITAAATRPLHRF